MFVKSSYLRLLWALTYVCTELLLTSALRFYLRLHWALTSALSSYLRLHWALTYVCTELLLTSVSAMRLQINIPLLWKYCFVNASVSSMTINWVLVSKLTTIQLVYYSVYISMSYLKIYTSYGVKVHNYSCLVPCYWIVCHLNPMTKEVFVCLGKQRLIYLSSL